MGSNGLFQKPRLQIFRGKKEITFQTRQNKTKLYMKLNLISDFNILALAGVLSLVPSNTILSFDLKDS